MGFKNTGKYVGHHEYKQCIDFGNSFTVFTYYFSDLHFEHYDMFRMFVK